MNERKWIDIKADFRSGGHPYFAGERLNEPAEQADRWIKAGWAVPAGSELPPVAPDISPKTLKVADGVHGVASTKA